MLYDLSCCLVHINYYCFVMGNLFDLHHHTTEVKGRPDSHRSVQSVHQDKSMSVPPGSLPTTSSTPAAAFWALDCHPPSEVTFVFFCKLRGCPTGSSTAGAVLNWLIFLAA